MFFPFAYYLVFDEFFKSKMPPNFLLFYFETKKIITISVILFLKREKNNSFCYFNFGVEKR
ncbi:MAG: hypothetical protein A3G95_04590 [Flavobacteria bacterium RIFCSPLOWO2_12_FULL_31_7]|nr:MAG: hypothetical protein A3G95_04590 [Flavobacteria bacterium RIFCSPLOWO2_12_FULL_31_7]